jgi:hypothetical protein
MFGIEDPVIYIGYLLTILSLLLCVIYGAINWNKGDDPEEPALETDVKWVEKEEEIQNQI